MTTSPYDPSPVAPATGPETGTSGADPTAPATQAEAPFDPYRFGAPEHPVPPEYAPPGYVPPQPGVPAQPAYGGYQYPPQAAPQYPYGGQYYGPPPPWATQYPQPRTGNGKAIAALVFGILSVLCFWASVFDLIPIALAVIFGLIAASDAKRTGQPGRTMAMWGVALGILGALAATITTIVVVSRIKPCIENYNSGSAEQKTCINQRLHI